MQLIKNLALLAGLLSAAAASDSLDVLDDTVYSNIEAREHCVKGVHVIATGGQGAVKHALGYLRTLATNITAAIPDSNIHQVAYPPNQANGSAAVMYAVPHIRQSLETYAKRCPHTPIVTIAYSVGGAADMNVFCGEPYDNAATGALDSKYKKNVIANIVYGDPTYATHHVPWSRGTCKPPQGGNPARVNSKACQPFGKITHSYCDYNDQICCDGNDESVHFSYPGKYDLKATKYVVSQYKKHKKHHSGKKHHHKHDGKKHHHKKHHKHGGKTHHKKHHSHADVAPTSISQRIKKGIKNIEGMIPGMARN